MDFLAELGMLAIGSRLKRASETIMAEGKRIYQAAGVDFEPKCFPIFYLLSRSPGISVTEAAQRLGLSHVAVGKLLRELEGRGLVSLQPDPTDKRRQICRLSVEGAAMRHRLEPIWASIRSAGEAVSARTGSGILPFLDELEAALADQALSRRAIAALRETSSSSSSSPLPPTEEETTNAH